MHPFVPLLCAAATLANGKASGTAMSIATVPGHPFAIVELVSERTLSANDTFTNQYRNVQLIDPAGARDLTLPALEKGLWYLIANKADAAETITVKNAAAATVCSLAQNKCAFVWCDGTAWYSILFTITIS